MPKDGYIIHCNGCGLQNPGRFRYGLSDKNYIYALCGMCIDRLNKISWNRRYRDDLADYLDDYYPDHAGDDWVC